MTDYNDAPPGSEDYATAYWSSEEGRARAAAERAVREPRKPTTDEIVADRLAKHNAAVQRRADIARLDSGRDPGPQPGELDAAGFADLYALQAEAADAAVAERGTDVDLEAAFEAMRS